MHLVLSLGVEPSRIIYSNTIKQLSHLKYAVSKNIQMMVFDNEAELVKIANCWKYAKLVTSVFFALFRLALNPLFQKNETHKWNVLRRILLSSSCRHTQTTISKKSRIKPRHQQLSSAFTNDINEYTCQTKSIKQILELPCTKRSII